MGEINPRQGWIWPMHSHVVSVRLFHKKNPKCIGSYNIYVLNVSSIILVHCHLLVGLYRYK